MEVPRDSYRADWEAIRVDLALKLEELEVQEVISTADDFNACLDRLMQVILEVIDDKIPKRKPHPTRNDGG